MTEGRLRIVYLMGRGRSGSTFAESMIARATGLTLIGESRLWPLTYRPDDACSCGEPKTACPFWMPVIEGLQNRSEVESAFRRTLSLRFLAILILPRGTVLRRFGRDIGLIQAFYRRIAALHGETTIIDSSKNPAFAFALSLAPDLELTPVHVVRHPAGVMHSWDRQRAMREPTAALHKIRKPLLRATVEWLASNLLAELAKFRMGVAHEAVRYESLVDDLDPVLRRLDTVQWRDDGVSHHAMAGNPGPTARSAVFRADTAWQSEMPLARRLLVAGLTWPLWAFYTRRS